MGRHKQTESGNKYAMAALKEKRGRLAGEIANLKREIVWRVEQLSHVDACLTILEPGFDPGKIGTRLVRRQVKLFGPGELSRAMVDILRRSGTPIRTADVVTALLKLGGYDEGARATLTERARRSLHHLTKRGVLKTSGAREGITWALA